MKKYLKNILVLLLGLVYFGFYFSGKFHILENLINSNIPYGSFILSYFTALIGFITVLGLVGIINLILEKSIKNHFLENSYAIFIIDFTVKIIGITKYILAFYVFSYLASLPLALKLIANKIYSILILIIFLYFLTIFTNKFFEEELIEKSKLKVISKNLLPFVNKIIVAVIWVVGAITIIGNLGYDITALIAGAGIGGLAIAFAAQKSIANIFGAIIILLNKPFKIGDYVGINGVVGVVKDIGLSYLTIIDKMGHQVMIPNEVIISNNVENFSVRKNRRTDFILGVEYGTNLKTLEKGVLIIENILEKYKGDNTISNYRVNFEQFGDFSLNISVTYFSLLNKDYDEYIKQKEQINLEIKNEFEKAKISMAFPTQELIIKKED